MAIVNVTTANTFNEWRIKTNETGTAVGELTNLTEALTRGTDVVGALTDISTDLATAEAIIALIPETYVNVVGDTMTGDLNFGDNDKVNFGIGADLEIYHNATDSIIKNSTGLTKIQGDDIRILDAAGTETLAKFIKDGSAELYHNNTKKIETTANGVTVAGDILISNAGTIGSATTTDAIAIASDGIVTFKDDILIKNGGTIGSATTPDAITIASAGDVSFRKNVIFEGSAADGFETTVSITNPTADRTWTLPNSSDTFVGKTTTDTLANKTLNSAILDGTISGTSIKDEDTLSSDSNEHLATQQSIKAYVDAQVTAQDLDFTADTGGALSIDLDSEALTIAGGTGIGSAGSGNTVTLNIDSTVTTLTGNQTLTNKTLTSAVINGSITGSSIKDEDNMASNSATHLATQQSIKAYVDNAAESRQDDVGAMISTTIAASAHLAINSGTVYQIVNPAGTSQAQWETIGVPSGTTAVKGIVFTALSAAGAGSGTMAKPATSSIQTNVSVAYDDASNVLSFVTPSLLTGDITGNAGTVTVNDTTDTTAYVGLWESASGTLAGKTDGGITYNAGTGVLNVSNGLTIGAAVINETDLEKIDGITNGTASANKAVVLNGSKNISGLGTISSGTITTAQIVNSTITLNASADIVLDAGGADVHFKDDGVAIGKISNTSSNFVFTSQVDDKDIIFKGQDGTSEITALTLDMSAAGKATFNSDVVVGGNLTINGTTTTVNSATLTVDDKNIELGSVSTPTDTTANGGGITLKGATDKTILWVNSTNSWDFNQAVKSTNGFLGNATTATTLATGRTIGMTGDVSWTSASFNGASTVTGTSAIGASKVTTAKIANLNVTRGKIANDAIDGTKIADDVVNSEHYVHNSIDALHLNVSGNGTTTQWLRSDGDGSMSWVTPPNNTYSAATTSNLGLIKLESNTVGATANGITTTGSRTYGLQVNSSGQGVVNVPWSDTNTNTNQLTTFTVSATHDTNAITISHNEDLFFAASTGIKCETTSSQRVTITNTSPNANHTGDVTGASALTIGALKVTRAKIAADAIDSTKLANDSVNSEHYVDGSIGRAHLAADIIDGTKIANDAINSEHYAANSIDEEHMANDSVGSAELKTLVTFKLYNSAGTVVKTMYGAGA